VSISVQKRSISAQKCSEVFKAGYFLPAFAAFLTRFPLPILPKRYTLTPYALLIAQEPTHPSETTQKSRKKPNFPQITIISLNKSPRQPSQKCHRRPGASSTNSPTTASVISAQIARRPHSPS
jgi:hypothetical protein